MILDSNKVIVPASQQEIFEFLKDASNLYHILPQDSISDFKSTKDDCSFKVQGGVIISLIHDGEEGIEKIFMKSGDRSPFPFRLTIETTEQNDGTEGYIHFDGEVNMFLKMMVEKPLGNLFNYMTKKLKEHFTK